jgi:hypothetical protein
MRLANRAALGAYLVCTVAGSIAATPSIAQMGGGSYGGGGSTPAPRVPQGQTSSKPSASSENHLSKAVGPQVVDAQKDLQSKDFQSAMTKLKAAQAVADRTPFDDYVINRLIAGAAIGLNDMPTAATAQEAAADSAALPDADKKAVYHDALQLTAYMKQWPKTIAYGQQLAQLNGLDYQTAANLAIAYYSSNDFGHAQQYAQQSMDMAKAAGQPPDQNAMNIVMSSQVKQNNQAGAEQTLEQLALQGNSPDAWGQLVGVAFGAKGMNDATALYLYRMLVLVGAMKASDYKEMGSLLNELGYPTESAKVLEQGVSAGKVSSAEVGAMLSKARRDAAADERALPQIAASAAKSRTGEQDVKLGEDYWGYGRYADAEAAGRRAMSKGGLKSPSEGPLLVGAAEVAQGKYADAMQTLSRVAGGEAVTRTGHLWSLYAQSKQGPTRASTQPAGQAPSQ